MLLKIPAEKPTHCREMARPQATNRVLRRRCPWLLDPAKFIISNTQFPSFLIQIFLVSNTKSLVFNTNQPKSVKFGPGAGDSYSCPTVIKRTLVRNGRSGQYGCRQVALYCEVLLKWLLFPQKSGHCNRNSQYVEGPHSGKPPAAAISSVALVTLSCAPGKAGNPPVVYSMLL